MLNDLVVAVLNVSNVCCLRKSRKMLKGCSERELLAKGKWGEEKDRPIRPEISPLAIKARRKKSIVKSLRDQNLGLYFILFFLKHCFSPLEQQPKVWSASQLGAEMGPAFVLNCLGHQTALYPLPIEELPLLCDFPPTDLMKNLSTDPLVV